MDETVMHPCRECGTPAVYPSTERRKAHMLLHGFDTAFRALWNLQEYWEEWQDSDSSVQNIPTCWKMAGMTWVFNEMLRKWYDAAYFAHPDIAEVLYVRGHLDRMERFLRDLESRLLEEKKRFDQEGLH